MKHAQSFLLMLSIVVMFVAAPAVADWFPGDPHKMHFPQLPDPQGWDVNATTPKILADDWMCSRTGYVDDIHFWGSWRHDDQGIITNIHLSIHADIPAVIDPATGEVDEHSRPGELLWSYDTLVPEMTYGDGQQGRYDSNPPEVVVPGDHLMFYQYNVTDIPEPFWQEEGTIYWLDIQVTVADPENTHWGWKTTEMHWNDDAVWGDWTSADPDTIEWTPLTDPFTQQTMDLAFVITPEPGTMLLLGLGGAVLIFRRTKRKEKRCLKESF